MVKGTLPDAGSMAALPATPMAIQGVVGMKRRGRFAFVCAIIAAAAQADQPGRAPLEAKRIRFAAETVDVRSQVNLLSADERPQAFDAGKRYVLQLRETIDPQRRAALEDAGVVFGDYIPDGAYVVDLSAANPEALAQLDLVDWVGEFRKQWKIDPSIGQRLVPFETPERIALAQANRLKLVITVFDANDVAATAQALAGFGVQVTGDDTIGDSGVIFATSTSDRLDAIAALDAVQFIEEAPELTLRNATVTWIVQSNVSNSTSIHSKGIRGEGQIVGVLDGQADQHHCSLDGGKILFYNSADGNDHHGTHVSCTAVGDSGSAGNLRGIAYLGNMVFHTVPSFSEAGITQRLNLHRDQGARMHTNSWGNDGTTSYNSLCRGFDAFIYNNEDHFVCLAVTNQATLRNPENAKNLMAVGASGDTPNQANHFSGGTGPTADGRRKPEIYAPGSITSASASACGQTTFGGTSMACPAIAGTAALVRQYYVDGYYPTGVAVGGNGFTPSGALIKATLLNSAVDMTGIAGFPSNLEGWGRVLADNALYFTGDARKLMVLDDIRNVNGLSTGQQLEYYVLVNSAAQSLKGTLVFTDPPAAATTGTGNAWINNLDLEAVSPGGTLYRGNVFTSGQSSTGGTADIRNNVEQVLRNSPDIGVWTFRVKGTAVNQGSQGFALIVTGDVAGIPAGSGDFDDDGDWDLVDFAAFQECFQVAPMPAGCEPGDMNANNLVEMGDLELFEATLGGPN